MEAGILILIAIVLIPFLWAISVTNRYAKLEAHIRESWANIDVVLKRRHDLIPNLVETVKGYAAHEREVLQRVVEARNRALDGGAAAESELVKSVNVLLARSEAYPELRSSANFLELQQELVNTEDRIAAARRFYNANVRDYNTLLESFPANLLRGERSPKEFYEIESIQARQVPMVDLKA